MIANEKKIKFKDFGCTDNKNVSKLIKTIVNCVQNANEYIDTHSLYIKENSILIKCTDVNNPYFVDEHFSKHTATVIKNLCQKNIKTNKNILISYNIENIENNGGCELTPTIKDV